jgi:SAM-dependent methyltransferase
LTAVSREYDAGLAADYWGGPRHDSEDELAAVLSLGEPPAVNRAYDAWETGLLMEEIGFDPGARALDLGTGVGRVAVRVAPRIGRLTAGDLAHGMLVRLRRSAERAGARNIDPIRLRSDRLPFPSDCFSLVLCLGLLEHLPRPIQAATLGEIARVLRRGGKLVLVLNNEASVLLRDRGDNPYRDGSQRESGYYCAVVSEQELLAAAASDFDLAILGSNLFYSLQRHASRRLEPGARGERRLAPFFEHAATWDLALKPVGALARAAADHHLHLLIRR